MSKREAGLGLFGNKKSTILSVDLVKISGRGGNVRLEPLNR